MKKLYLVLEHRQADVLLRLRAQNDALKHQVEVLSQRVITLEQRFGFEVMLNSELIDLCNLNNIPYRETLNFKSHPF